MLLLIAVLVFVAVAGGVFIVASLLDQRQSQARLIRERLASVEQAAERDASQELLLLRDELLSGIPALNRLLARSARISLLQQLLIQAEVRVRAGKFLLVSVCCGLCGAIVGLALTEMKLAALLLMLLAGAAPLAYVSRRRKRRFHRFEEFFPEAMELLARAVRAGHAFTTGLEMVGSEIGEPVGGEFRKLFEEQKYGLPLREALLNLAERVPLLDVKFFVSSVMLQRETGGNLAEILDKLSYVIRERFKIQRQVRVFTAQGRLTMVILMCLPPGLALAMSLLNPSFIRPLFEDKMGHMMVLWGVSLQVIGFFLIRKIIRIKV